MFVINAPEQLATYLKAMRKSRHMTQTDLGRKLELSKARISAIEKEPGRVGVALLLRVLHALDAHLAVEDTARTRTSASGTARTGEW
ncbi:hypothetical protein BH09GEM1_BH09GEM1_35630 [soil metagenome]